ncbi:UDP-glucose 4-epimerase GalE [bacterium]|nr:UDP-glucose 4-epimerase GalE [bacterium]MBU1073387.1 UDP-glucose 4-epimerase GalE [bacterium]MBU1677175.1 UDP-glucose 4-epimerase GalE [bacterium]
MRVLVTGGAGYIGSVTARALAVRGHEVEILDDFSTGHRAALLAGAALHEGSLLDGDFLAGVFARPFDAVMHFAAFSLIGESVAEPLLYYRNNVAGSAKLLSAVTVARVPRFIFSSSAAVYGKPDLALIPEDAPTVPVNPYGRTKLAMEWMLDDAAAASGLSAVALRYFNACGATSELGEDHTPETHLIPRLLRSLQDPTLGFAIYGDDYPTPDGTCIRDYIHVADLADAHVLALEWVDRPGLTVMNLGTETGHSVREVVTAVSRVTGRAITPAVAQKRAGDPPRLVAASQRARRLLDWRPTRSDLQTVIRDAWRWHGAHSGGYAPGGQA